MPTSGQPDPTSHRHQAGDQINGDGLPLDRDVDAVEPSGSRAGTAGTRSRGEQVATRAAHQRVGLIVVVFLGGSLGTGCRYGLSQVMGSPTGFPVATLVANICGAFLLGVLLEALSRKGPDHGRRRMLRLLLGTGFLGGFTTYSSFAVEAIMLLSAGDMVRAVIYVMSTVFLGAIGSATGILATATYHQHKHHAETVFDAAPVAGGSSGGSRESAIDEVLRGEDRGGV